MRPRTLTTLGLTLLLSAGTALAQGQIVFYEHDDFRGQRVTFETATSSLDSYRWNDRATSLKVLSGSWEVCKDSGFRGCEVLFNGGQGEHRDLSTVGWNDRISSVRPIVPPPDRRPNGGHPPVTQAPEDFQLSGRGALALEGQRDQWFNNLNLRLFANGAFNLRASTDRSQVFTGTYRWSGRNRVDLDVTDGPGRGTGSVYLDRGDLESVEIVGSFGRGIYTFSFINQHYAPWN